LSLLFAVLSTRTFQSRGSFPSDGPFPGEISQRPPGAALFFEFEQIEEARDLASVLPANKTFRRLTSWLSFLAFGLRR
jgi:hypothetical protein